MPLTTVAVTFSASDQNGNPLSGARFRARLDRTEIDGGFVVPEVVEAFSGADGTGVLNLWPNVLGVGGSSYRVQAWNPDTGKNFLNGYAIVPGADCFLSEILVTTTPLSYDDSTQALLGARTYRDEARLARDDAQAAKSTATDKAAIATDKAAIATDKAQIATTKANEASSSAAASEASRQAIDQRIYPGIRTSAPTTRPDGSAIQDGDQYSSATQNYISRGGVWVNYEATAIAKASEADASATLAGEWAVKTGAAVSGGEWSAKKHATDAASSAQTATTQAVLAAAAKADAELARDAALAGGNVYPTESAGRAAVADGASFLVQGAGEAAALLYRRVNSGSSTYITTYPSLAGTWAIDASKRTAHIGKNRFNPADKNVAAGYTVNGATGALTATAGFTATGFIPVTAGVTYTASQGRGYAWYDASRIYISGATPGSAAVLTVTAPAGAAYFRTSASDAHIAAFQLEVGSTSTLFAPYTEEPALQSDVVTTQSVRRRAVTPDRVSFLSPGKNKFDKDSATIGKYISSTGVIDSNATYDTSDYIAVTAGAAYKSSHNIRFSCYFAADMSVVAGGITADSTTFTVPSGAAFVRVSMYHANLAAFQLELGATATAYESFRWVNTLTTPAADGAITTAALADGAVTLAKTAFAVASKNLFNPATINVGKAVNNVTGALFDAAAYFTSDYISVAAGSTYAVSFFAGAGVRFTSYYNSDLGFVAGGANAAISTFTPPAGAAYIRISFYNESISGTQVELGAVATSYAEFGSKIPQSVIQPPDVPTIVMPPTIFGVQGRECNVYLDNLHVASAADYFHDVTSASGTGAQQAERWTWTPAGAVTSGSLTVAAHRKLDGVLLASVTAAQRAAASSAGSGANKKVLVIGDSLVNAGVITQTLLDVAATDVMAVTLLGTRGTGGNKHEGRGGWTIGNYTSNFSDGTYGANPFWISGAVNFPQYLTNNSIATPDWVAIHLGINDVFGQTTDAGAISTATAAFDALDTLITSIKAAGAGVKVALMLPTPPASSQDAFGASYGTGQTRWRFKRNIMLWTQTLITRYAGQEASRIYIAPTNTAIDTTNNVSYAAAAPVNSRSSVSVARQNNGVHPADSGYQQIGDALWAFFKYYAAV